MKKITAVVIGLILVSSVFAQPGARRGPQGDCQQPGIRMEERADRGENRDEMMAFMLSEKLDLSIEQADKFFPRFREHQEAIERIRKESFEANKAIQDKIKDGKEITDTELTKVLKSMDETQKKLSSERKKFIDGMKGVLDNTQLAKLSLAPKHFAQKKMMHRDQRPQNRR